MQFTKFHNVENNEVFINPKKITLVRRCILFPDIHTDIVLEDGKFATVNIPIEQVMSILEKE